MISIYTAPSVILIGFSQVYSFITAGFNFKPYYYWFYNSLMVPPSAVQFPMFDKGMPLAVNYRGMGSYIANALIKPYDEVGKTF